MLTTPLSSRLPQPAARHRVAVIDPHPATRRGLRGVLERTPEFEVCCECASLAEGLAMVEGCQPAITFVDLPLPDGDGVAAVREVRARHAAGHVLVFSSLDERFFASPALQAGASGYVMKNAPPAELVRALRSLARGRRHVGPHLAEQLETTCEGRHASPTADAAAPLVRSLTRRQQQVLRLLAQGATSAEAARALGMSVKTLDTHCGHIKSRLALRSARELLCYAVSLEVAAGQAPAASSGARGADVTGAAFAPGDIRGGDPVYGVPRFPADPRWR